MILALSYMEAGLLLESPNAASIKAIVAIGGHGEPTVDIPDGLPHLILRFDDWRAADPGDPIRTAILSLRRQHAANHGRNIVLPTREHMEQVVDFARQHRDGAGNVMCHCQAGISRSTAVALACLATWTGPGHEEKCVIDLMNIRPQALPHEDLVAFADDILERDGALIDAVNRIVEDY